MRKADVQHEQEQNHSAQQGCGAAVESPQGEQLAQLDATMSASPVMTAQRKSVEGINNNSRI